MVRKYLIASLLLLFTANAMALSAEKGKEEKSKQETKEDAARVDASKKDLTQASDATHKQKLIELAAKLAQRAESDTECDEVCKMRFQIEQQIASRENLGDFKARAEQLIIETRKNIAELKMKPSAAAEKAVVDLKFTEEEKSKICEE